MRITRPALLVLVAAASLSACSAYYLPGTYPQEFTKGQKLRGEISSPCSTCSLTWGSRGVGLATVDPLMPNTSNARPLHTQRT